MCLSAMSKKRFSKRDVHGRVFWDITLRRWICFSLRPIDHVVDLGDVDLQWIDNHFVGYGLENKPKNFGRPVGSFADLTDEEQVEMMSETDRAAKLIELRQKMLPGTRWIVDNYLAAHKEGEDDD